MSREDSRIIAVLLVTGLASARIAHADSPTLDAGPLRLQVHISRTAHLFHVVDQLAEWSEFCHRQYRRNFGELDDYDRDLLAKHADLRKRKPWGEGLEQTFYAPTDLQSALQAGIRDGHLSESEAELERKILDHFAPRIEELMTQQRSVLESFKQKLHDNHSHLVEFAQKVSRFFHDVQVDVPVYLIANPDRRNFGGGYNGQRLTLEVPGGYDAYPTFLHEVLHAFIDTRKTQLEEAVKSIDGLDYQTLNEGIAFAFAPGILHPESAEDPLRQEVTDQLGSKNLSDSPTRFRRFGLALRPLLREALDDKSQTLTTFLPRALDAWKVLQELDAAWSAGYKTPGTPARPSVFIMVPAGERDYFKPVIDRLQGSWGDRWGRNHTKKNYAEMTGQASPGDTFILLFSLDSPDRIPSAYEDLLPRPWKEVEDMLKRDESVTLRSFARRMGILILAARNDETLLALIRRTDFPD